MQAVRRGVRVAPHHHLVRLKQQKSLSTRVPSMFENAMVEGGDDRSVLKPATLRNKYNVAPWPLQKEAVFRGSCTCNPPTESGYKAAEALYEKMVSKETNYEKEAKRIQDRLAKVFEMPAGTGVWLCPSGSDAEYIPVVAMQALGATRVVNVVTQYKEIGAGSAPAAALEYFSTLTPQGVGTVEPNARLNGTDDFDLDTVIIPARNLNGDAVEPAMLVDYENLKIGRGGNTKKKTTKYLVHAVYGGKTGLRDAVDFPKGMIGIVDACQGRFTNSELKSWLNYGHIVLITGSKFYRGPPFSGAVLFPPSLMKELAQQSTPPPLLANLAEFLSPADLPETLSSWRSALPATNQNPGLALRWSAALHDIEAARPYNVEIAQAWATQVADVVSTKFPDTLRVFESQRCIVSLNLRASSSSDFLSYAQLRQVYDWMTSDCRPLFQAHNLPTTHSDVLERPCAIGQPVEVTQEKGVLRLALGVDSFDAYARNPDTTLLDDITALTKLHLLASNFPTLSASSASSNK